jgi:hypothetical protein
MTLRRLTLLGLAFGLLAGLVAAVAIPRSSPGQPRATTTTSPAPAPGPAGVLRVAPTRPAYGDVRLVVRGRARIEARAADPLGGPEWAVRVFHGDRVIRPGARRHGVDPVISQNLCAQVGRLHRGQFGWLDSRGTFRPLRMQPFGTGAWCGSRLPDLHGEPVLEALSPITNPRRPAAAVKSTVVWGLAGTAARSVDLRIRGRDVAVPATAHHAFLVVSGPGVDQHDVRATVEYGGGRAVTLPRRVGSPGFQGVITSRPAAPGRPLLAARAPDPNGGLPFALIATHGAEGGWCMSTGARVVGDRAGGVDYLTDTLNELRSGAGGGGSCFGRGGDAHDAQMFRDRPVLLAVAGGGGDLAAEGGDPGGAGRIARRTQKGMTIYSARVAPDVVAVTLETPRDVRTLIPGGPAHAILAVYDGTFPAGQVRLIARYRDGHTKTQAQPELPF